MRIGISIFAAAAFAMALSADTTGLLKEETEYTPRNGLFSVTLPAGDTSGDLTKIISLNLPSGTKFRKGGKGGRGGGAAALEASRSKVRDGTVFLAASIGVPGPLVKEMPEEKRMGLYRDLFVTSKKGKVTGEKEIKQGAWAGKEYAVEFAETRMRMQLFMDGGFGFYAMAEGASEERLAAKDVDRFFASFKLQAKE